MKQIICPKCGKIEKYYMVETVKRCLLFDANDEAQGQTPDLEVYSGAVKRCPICDGKVKVKEGGQDGVHL